MTGIRSFVGKDLEGDGTGPHESLGTRRAEPQRRLQSNMVCETAEGAAAETC